MEYASEEELLPSNALVGGTADTIRPEISSGTEVLEISGNDGAMDWLSGLCPELFSVKMLAAG